MKKPKEYAAFEGLLKRVLAVPKEEIDRRGEEWKKASPKRKRGRPKKSQIGVEPS
jgi:hypothetical protein